MAGASTGRLVRASVVRTGSLRRSVHAGCRHSITRAVRTAAGAVLCTSTGVGTGRLGTTSLCRWRAFSFVRTGPVSTDADFTAEGALDGDGRGAGVAMGL